MRLLGGLILLSVLALTGCSGAPDAGTGASTADGDLTAAQRARVKEMNRIVRTVTWAIASPRQLTADGYLRATLSTAAAKDGRLSVLVAERVNGGKSPSDPQKPYAHFVWQIAVDDSQGEIPLDDPEHPLDTCYDLQFNFYGAIEPLTRSACPRSLGSVTEIPGPEPSAGTINPTAGG